VKELEEGMYNGNWGMVLGFMSLDGSCYQRLTSSLVL